MFDPYEEWLGIPREHGRPTYYDLLGVSPDELDVHAIEDAALRRTGHIRKFQLSHTPECTQLLNEIGQALDTLLDPAKRREYDAALRKELAKSVPAAATSLRSWGPGGPVGQSPERSSDRFQVRSVFQPQPTPPRRDRNPAGAGTLAPGPARALPPAFQAAGVVGSAALLLLLGLVVCWLLSPGLMWTYLNRCLLLLMWMSGIGLSLVYWQRHPRASLLALLGSTTFLLESIITPFLYQALGRVILVRGPAQWGAVYPLLNFGEAAAQAGAGALLLAAVFAWRGERPEARWLRSAQLTLAVAVPLLLVLVCAGILTLQLTGSRPVGPSRP
jgi:hypothetical protein